MIDTWYLGIGSALLAAFCWALSAVWYKQLTNTFSNIALNFHKGWITLLGLFLFIPFVDGLTTGITSFNVMILLLSGAIGVGIGDTALFAALKRLSSKETLLVAESAAPIIVMFGGILFLSEYLSIWQVIAIIIIIIAVDLVIGIRGRFSADNPQLLSGVGFAMVAALCQATGVLITRSVFVEDNMHPTMSTILRILGGLLFVLLWVKLDIRKFKTQPGMTLSPAIIQSLFFASMIGTLLALSLVQFSLVHVNAASVQTLIATSAIFSALIAVYKGESLDLKVWLGMGLAWVGVTMMTFL